MFLFIYLFIFFIKQNLNVMLCLVIGILDHMCPNLHFVHIFYFFHLLNKKKMAFAAVLWTFHQSCGWKLWIGLYRLCSLIFENYSRIYERDQRSLLEC